MSESSSNPFSPRKLDLTSLGAAVGFIICGFLVYAFPWYAGLGGGWASGFHGVAYGVFFLGTMAAIGGLDHVSRQQARGAMGPLFAFAMLGGVLYGLHRLAGVLDGWGRPAALFLMLLVASLAALVACVTGAEALERMLARGARKREQDSVPKRVASWVVAGIGLLTPFVEFLPKVIDAVQAVLGG